mmetsp:Transcript_24792/g.83148  ORF Transcript_24792/g.83148 Transcript_24792/m.83148 type:complete len:338 (+) Transcript_24792:160-1173(+)
MRVLQRLAGGAAAVGRGRAAAGGRAGGSSRGHADELGRLRPAAARARFCRPRLRRHGLCQVDDDTRELLARAASQVASPGREGGEHGVGHEGRVVHRREVGRRRVRVRVVRPGGRAPRARHDLRRGHGGRAQVAAHGLVRDLLLALLLRGPLLPLLPLPGLLGPVETRELLRPLPEPHGQRHGGVQLAQRLLEQAARAPGRAQGRRRVGGDAHHRGPHGRRASPVVPGPVGRHGRVVRGAHALPVRVHGPASPAARQEPHPGEAEDAPKHKHGDGVPGHLVEVLVEHGAARDGGEGEQKVVHGHHLRVIKLLHGLVQVPHLPYGAGHEDEDEHVGHG